MHKLQDDFPALYQQLLPDLMLQSVPDEDKAQCSRCSMTQRDPDLGAAQKHLFRADTKCCTYQPKLVNYLVGGLLQDDRPALAEGQRRVRARIESRIGVTPWWIGSSPLAHHLYQQGMSSFGKSARLRCPYYATESGHCTVWGWRESVCSTWYCKYQAGKDGLNFWVSLKAYMHHVERILSRYAMLQVNPEFVLDDQDSAFYTQEGLNQQQLDEEPPASDVYARLWRQYAGREEEYYRLCYETVRNLSSDEIQHLLGLDGQIKGLDVKRKWERATEQRLPERLRWNPQVNIRWLDSGEIALSAYSEYDALALPGAVYPMLLAFDGTPTHETRQKLRQNFQADLADEVLLTLYHYRILEPV